MNVKPGDLAVLIRARVPENVGLICRIVEFAYTDYDGANWLVEVDRPHWAENVFGGRELRGGTGIAPDAWLRPIRSDGITKEEVSDLYAPQELVHLAATNGPHGPVQAPQETA